MMNTVTQTANRFWWLMILRGILAIIFGLIALVFPGIALLAIIYVFAAYALVDGITAAVVAIQTRNSSSRWWVLLLEGLVGVVIGILVFVWPGETALVLLYLVAIWAVITGIMELSGAFVIPGAARLHWGLAIAGILSIIFGVILFIHPGAGLLAILWLVGIYAIIFGIFLIVHAIQVRSRA